MRFNATSNPLKMGTFPQYEYPDCLRRYAEIARRIGLKGKTDEELFNALLEKLETLKAELGLPKTIREALGDDVSEEAFLNTLDKMSEDAYDDQCTGANPRYPLVEEIKQMYKNAYYGKMN
jgi:acetaldehyde dehydrogenase/alcohol dehydrogenase